MLDNFGGAVTPPAPPPTQLPLLLPWNGIISLVQIFAKRCFTLEEKFTTYQPAYPFYSASPDFNIQSFAVTHEWIVLSLITLSGVPDKSVWRGHADHFLGAGHYRLQYKHPHLKRCGRLYCKREYPVLKKRFGHARLVLNFLAARLFQ